MNEKLKIAIEIFGVIMTIPLMILLFFAVTGEAVDAMVIVTVVMGIILSGLAIFEELF